MLFFIRLHGDVTVNENICLHYSAGTFLNNIVLWAGFGPASNRFLGDVGTQQYKHESQAGNCY